MSFDRLARVYEPLERLLLGGALHRCRTAFLSEVRGVRRVLIPGEGDGRFLADLLRVNCMARVDCVDESAAMIARSLRRLARAGLDPRGRVRFFRADIRSWLPPENGYDLIATNFFLDCFDNGEAEKLAARIQDWICPGAVWLVGDFNVPPRGLARWRAGLWVSFLYLFFRAATGIAARRLPAIKLILPAFGFRLEVERQTEAGMLVSQLWRHVGKRGRFSLEGVAEKPHPGQDQGAQQAHF